MLKNRISNLGLNTRMIIVATLLAIFPAIWLYAHIDWDSYIWKEEGFVMLEEVVYDIIEDKDVVQPLGEHLQRYEVSFDSNGTIYIELDGGAEDLRVELSDEFEIKSIKREKTTLIDAIIAGIALFISIAFVAYIGVVIIYAIYWSIRWLFKKR